MVSKCGSPSRNTPSLDMRVEADVADLLIAIVLSSRGGVDGAVHVRGQRETVDDEEHAAHNVERDGLVHVVRAFVHEVDVPGQVVPAAEDEEERADERAERGDGAPADDVLDLEAGDARVLDAAHEERPAAQLGRLGVPVGQRVERAQHLAQLRAVVVADGLDEVQVGAREEHDAANHEGPATEEASLAVPHDRVLRVEVDGTKEEEQRA
ncbi:hypothetical protein ON010_g14743 [Phytophthora cinnamomi]|nr:hypothetical protein ON010_g14743 [Phytophthora cinnamomi]